MDILRNNLEAILAINPVLAAKVLSVTGNEKYDVFVDNDPANINFVLKEDFSPLYKGKASVETEVIYSDLLKFQRYPYLYFFGLGNGVLYKMLLNNQMHKRIVVYEPELEIIYIVLSLIDFSQELSEGRLRIELPQDMNFDTMVNVIFTGSPKLYAKVYDLLTPFDYYERYHDQIVAINYLAVEGLQHLAYSMGNDVIDSLIGVEHHIQNLPRMVKGPTLLEAATKGKNTSLAVVVSTGPSLAKQLPLLKEYADYVTVLSVDASFPILVQNGIRPDFVFSLERVARTATFYQKTPKSGFKDVNFLLSSVSHRELVESIVDGTLQINTRPFGYIKSFGHHPWGYLGAGMSSANMAYEFAAMAGFEKIVLIGQDLAYGKDGLSHSSGHVFGDDEIKHKNSDLFTTAYGGEGEVQTTLVWQMFKNYFEIAIAQMNGSNRATTYNATEGGARIEGAVEMSFGEVLHNFADTSAPKRLAVLDVPDEMTVDNAVQSINSTIKEFFEFGNSLKEQTESVFLKVAKEVEKLEELKAQNRLEAIEFDDLLKLNEEIDQVKALFEEPRFDELFGTILMPLMLHQEIELATIMVRSSEEEIEKKVKLIDWIYAHRFWLFSLAGSIQNTLDVIARAVLTWQESDELKETIDRCREYARTRGGLEYVPSDL